jgi:hypothetical protein
MIQFSYDEVSRIVKASKSTVENDRRYQMLNKGFLQKIWDGQINHQILFSIAISPADLDKIEFENLYDNLINSIRSTAEVNYIKVDNVGKTIDKKYIEGDTLEIKKRLQELSINDYIFFFGEQGITQFINGRAVEDNNIFYSRIDRIRFMEKKDISKIDEVMENYAKQNVTQQVNYMCFFADNSVIRQINPQKVNENILRNKPEHYMRDHLCNYLTEHMRYTFTTEPELGQSKRELDIYFDVCGELYFIEVKWLGISVNDNGTGFSTKYTDSRARDGVIQTLQYIEELMNTSEKSLRHGYLAVYDAREKQTPIDFKGYSFVNDNLKKYLPYFSVLKVINLNKRHPA